MMFHSALPSAAPSPARFRAAAGTVRGLEHARVGRNNQDGVALHVEGDVAVAAVTDGCSSGAWSEVGARFGAAWLAAHLPRIARESEPAEWAAAVERGMIEALGALAGHLATDAAARTAAIGDFLLFSFIVAVMAGRRAVVLGAGDGVFAVDGVTTVLDPGPENAPAYLGYALLPEGRAPLAAAPRVRTLFDAGASDVITLAVCTDGALDLLKRTDDGERGPSRLDALARDPKVFANPSLLQKRLMVLADRDRLLRDDTSVALLARAEEGA